MIFEQSFLNEKDFGGIGSTPAEAESYAVGGNNGAVADHHYGWRLKINLLKFDCWSESFSTKCRCPDCSFGTSHHALG